MYKYVSVWKRLSSSSVLHYRCFQSLSTGLYSVQSSDRLDVPPSPEQAAYLNQQFLELFVEDPPDSRSKGFESLAEAIRYHDETFSG